jgi:hypothetical protein
MAVGLFPYQCGLEMWTRTGWEVRQTRIGCSSPLAPIVLCVCDWEAAYVAAALCLGWMGGLDHTARRVQLLFWVAPPLRVTLNTMLQNLK